MNTDGMIKVTGAKPIDLVKAAYALSNPQGMGFLHARAGELSDEDAQEILARAPASGTVVARMDYVHGRSCKFAIYRDDQGDLWIRKDWYDHTDAQLAELLERCGVEQPAN